MNYTKEQEQAIFLRGKNIMVSAGAGAGKTRVLVSRMAELIMDKEHPIEADRFLVMTFTNAAAAEMKERIGTELEERLEKDPDNLYLRKQIRKIRQADISTIHSFCNHLIRTHYNELAIDPSFRIGEEGELFLLRQQAVEQVLEEAYASGRESFLQFVEAYAPGKNDTVLEEMIEDLYHFSRSFPNADGWFEKTGKEAAILAGKDGWDTSAAVTLLLSKAQKESLQIQEELYQLLESVTEDSPEKYTGLLQEIKEYIDSLTQAKDYNSYYKVLSQKSISSFPRASQKEKEWELYEEVKEFHQKVREQINSQKENVFTTPAEELQREAAVIYPLLEEYMALTKRFAEIYFLCKKEKNVYDFDDLEHFALELLVESYDKQGEAQPSETAKELSKKYKMIFVDEYQDTNLVQETILEMLLNKKHNSLFTVGDVKQSIYRFRQARPDLFLRRKDQYISQVDAGVSIELRDNFRSAPGVLTFTNYIFSQLMEKEFGGVDYNEKTALRPGDGGPMMQDEETSEILFFQKDSASALKEVPEDILAESAVICKRIKELIEEGYHYGDMVILLRSGAGRMEPMAEFLEQEGIPVSCDNKTGYFQTREITVMLNYLSIVDNIYQDIPMASVMLSSIGKFTEEELVKLRVLIEEPVRGKYTLYDFMRLYMQEGTEEELKKKIRDFLMDLLYFRQQKKEQPLSTLLWDIYERTGFYYDVQLMPDGEAEDYEKTVFKGLFYFNRYMKQLKSYEIEMGEAGTSMEEEDVVKIMTIHKSKGLEFPVVFVSGLSKKFNRMDLNKAVLCHPELGIGMECVNTTLRFHHPSLMKKAIQEKAWKDTLEEEMRILYVAMTRAKRKLILTGLIKSEELEAGMRASIQAQKWRAGSMMDWILPIISEQFQNTDKIWLKARLFSWSDIEELFNAREREEAAFSYRHFMEEYVEGQDSSLIKKAFSHVYPNMEATKWKRKYSVSELKSLSQITLPNEESVVYEPDEEERIIPQFLKEEREEVGGAAKGTIVHKIMEMLPFAKIQTKKQLFDWITDLEQNYPESKQISAKWLYRGIEAFLFSEQGEKIRKMDEAGKVKKELPFTVGLPVSLINQDTEAEDTVVVQGVIDACADMGNHLCLIDYKTDQIKEGEEQQLLDRYGNQMLYYKAALEQILEKRVSEIYLYSFSLKKFISVEKILTSISGE